MSQLLLPTALLLISNIANAAVGSFFVHTSGFESYYGGPADGSPSSCYNSGNNRVYETARFLVYSAGSSDQAVITLANLHEEALTELQQRLGIADSDLGIGTSPNTKMKVCSDARVASPDGGGTGAASGLGTSVSALDNPATQAMLTPFNYKYGRELVRHELTHYVQQKLIGDSNPYGSSGVERWFAEGLASFFENDQFKEAQTSTGIANWMDAGKKNPISVKTYSDQSGYSSGDIYPYYRAAVEFIFHANGAGNSIQRTTQLFRLMRQGSSFSSAMSASFSYKGNPLTTSYLQTNYRSLLTGFYSQLESAVTISNSPSSTIGALTGINDIVRNEVVEYGVPGYISGGILKLNPSKLPDGQYKLYVADNEDMLNLKGPITLDVKSGKLLATNCNIAALSCTYTPPVTVTPQTGWWANPNESTGGRGFFFDIRGGNMFLGVYTYGPDGLARWHVAGGAMTSSTSFSGQLAYLCCGQSLSSSVKAATTLTSPGNITVNFSSAKTATIILPGGASIPVERFNIVQNGTVSIPSAGQPETGFWIGEGEIQRGFSLEIQNGTMFLVGYMYDQTGNAVWYGSLDAMSSPNLYQSKWQQWGNGQPLTGPLKAVGIINTNLGPITIQFADSQNARLTMPGGYTVNFKRFVF